MEIKPEEYKDSLSEQFLSVHEAAQMLDISEEELRGLVQKHQVQTHNIAGVFLRLKKKDVEELKNKWRIERELFPKKERFFPHHRAVQEASALQKLRDFWYFNDFYVFCCVLIAVLLYFIVSSQ